MAGALALGLGLSTQARPDALTGTACAVALIACALVLRESRVLLLAAGLCVAGVTWGGVRLEAFDHSALTDVVGQVAQVEAEVTSPVRTGATRLRTFVRVRRFDGRRLAEPAQLEAPLGLERPRRGDVLNALVRVTLPEGPRETDEGRSFDESAYLARNGIQVVLEAPWFEVTGARGGLAGTSDRIRRFLAAGMGEGMGAEQRALVRGVVLGEDEALDDELLQRFRDSGLFHLLAVSGQNVAYVVAGVLLLGWAAGVPRAAAQLLAIAAILAYVGAVGWQPSVARAGVVGSLACLAWLLSRPGDRWYFLILGAIALLGWNPYSLLDPGFQLSFAAVAAIFLLVPVLERSLAKAPFPRKLLSIVAVASGCGFATAPILWIQFGSIPVWSVVANALAEPVVAPLLGFGLLTALLARPLPDAAAGLGWVNGHFADYLAWCANTVGAAPFARVESGRWAAAITLASVAPFAWLALRTRRRRRIALGAVASVAAILVVCWALVRPGVGALGPAPVGLRVTVLDVGQGDAILVQAPGVDVLVDQGEPRAHVAQRLRSLGVSELELLVFSHPQRDHLGGAVDVLEQVAVGRVVDPTLDVESSHYEAAIELAQERGVPITVARQGMAFSAGRLRVDVLWPPSAGLPGDDPNDLSVVLLVSYGAIDVLLTGDAESPVLRRLELPDIDILKVSHHGSDDPGLPELLRRIEPEVAVISSGKGNRFGHPHPASLAALAEAGVAVYRTDLQGDVTLESTDGRSITVATEHGS